VDDDLDDQEIFGMAVKDISGSIECHFANDGWLAVQKLLMEDDFMPAYIFIDVNMPRMNGLNCLVEIKKIERLKKVPVYMYSTSADKKMVQVAKHLGAADFIIKQTTLTALMQVLKNIFRL
jgi:PleD family two-component response regulator